MSNIQKNSENKIISPAQVLLLLIRIRTKLYGRTDIISAAVYDSSVYWSNPAQTLKTIKDVSFDNPSFALEWLGEDLFNDVNDVKEIPNYTAADLHNGREVLIYGGRGCGRTSYVRYLGI